MIRIEEGDEIMRNAPRAWNPRLIALVRTRLTGGSFWTALLGSHYGDGCRVARRMRRPMESKQFVLLPPVLQRPLEDETCSDGPNSPLLNFISLPPITVLRTDNHAHSCMWEARFHRFQLPLRPTCYRNII